MPATSGLKALWLSYFSQPATDRLIYRTIRKRKLRKFLEVGMGDGQRALRIISLAQRYQPGVEIDYAAIDLFEARPSSAAAAALPLKEAHRQLRAAGARAYLIPGEPNDAIARVANSLSGVELVLFTGDGPIENFGRAWFFLPRMLAPNAIVLLSGTDGAAAPGDASTAAPWRVLSHAEIQSLATCPRRRAA